MNTQLWYGIHSITARLSRTPHGIKRMLISRDPRDSRVLSLLEQATRMNIDCGYATREELDQWCGHCHHQGIVAWVLPTNIPKHIDDVWETIPKGKSPLFLILDGVTDPHNLGACLRTADAMGVDAVIAPKDRSAPLNATAAKVASGAADHVPYLQVTNLARCMRSLKEEGLWIAGTAPDEQAMLLQQGDWSLPLAWVMGSEGRGLRRLTRELCDFLVFIPMFGYVQSLNVSVTTGMVLYETQRQRNKCIS